MGSRQQGNVLSSLVFPVVFVIVFVLLIPFPPVCCEPHFSHAKGRVCKGAAMVEQIQIPLNDFTCPLTPDFYETKARYH